MSERASPVLLEVAQRLRTQSCHPGARAAVEGIVKVLEAGISGLAGIEKIRAEIRRALPPNGGDDAEGALKATLHDLGVLSTVLHGGEIPQWTRAPEYGVRGLAAASGDAARATSDPVAAEEVQCARLTAVIAAKGRELERLRARRAEAVLEAAAAEEWAAFCLADDAKTACLDRIEREVWRALMARVDEAIAACAHDFADVPRPADGDWPAARRFTWRAAARVRAAWS